MKRWIIRSFFIGLLLLCVGGWLVSFKVGWVVGYNNVHNHNEYEMVVHWGKIRFSFLDGHHAVAFVPDGWFQDTFPAYPLKGTNADADLYGRKFVGFESGEVGRRQWISIPFWFPTTISAAFLWLVWRKTRPKPKGRAFPVELEKPMAGQGGQAG